MHTCMSCMRKTACIYACTVCVRFLFIIKLCWNNKSTYHIIYIYAYIPCIHTYICISIYMYIPTHIAYIYIYICRQINIHIHTNIYIHIYTYRYRYIRCVSWHEAYTVLGWCAWCRPQRVYPTHPGWQSDPACQHPQTATRRLRGRAPESPCPCSEPTRRCCPVHA